MRHPTKLRSPRTRNLFLRLSGYLSKRRKVQLVLLFGVMILSGTAELFTLGLIIPFLSVLTDPDQIWKISNVRVIAGYVGVSEPSELIIPLTLIFSSATIVATVVRLINLRLNCFLAASIGSDLSCEAFKRTIYKPYAYHIASNSSNLISGIATNLNRTVAAINSLLQLITSLVVSIGLFFGLLLINWKIAISAACVFGGLYVFIALRSRKNLSNSKHIVNLAEKQIKVIQEGLGAIREVILGGNQKFYLDKYSEVDLVYKSSRSE